MLVVEQIPAATYINAELEDLSLASSEDPEDSADEAFAQLAEEDESPWLTLA